MFLRFIENVEIKLIVLTFKIIKQEEQMKETKSRSLKLTKEQVEKLIKGEQVLQIQLIKTSNQW